MGKKRFSITRAALIISDIEMRKQVDKVDAPSLQYAKKLTISQPVKVMLWVIAFSNLRQSQCSKLFGTGRYKDWKSSMVSWEGVGGTNPGSQTELESPLAYRGPLRVYFPGF